MIIIKPITNRGQWDKFIINYPKANFLQSWNWGEVLRLEGHHLYRLGIFTNNHLTGICQAAAVRARRGRQLIVPGGPLIDWQSPIVWPALLKQLIRLARTDKLDYLKLRSQLADSLINREIFYQQGFRLSSQHFTADHTWVLDLEHQSSSDLLAGMRKNTRSAIKKGLKLRLKVKKSSTQADLETLIEYDQATSTRQGFISYSSDYYRHIHQIFAPIGRLSYYKIYHPNGQLLVIDLIIHYHRESIYYISGSSLESRNLPAAPTLLWHIIQDRQKIDSRFNFWGIAPPGVAHHRYRGVTTFKRGFGGRAVNYVPAMELPLAWRYWPTHLFESIMKLKNNL